MKRHSDEKLTLEREARTLTRAELALARGDVSPSFASALFESSVARSRRDPTTPEPRLVAGGSVAR
jgi:hypothetical protein